MVSPSFFAYNVAIFCGPNNIYENLIPIIKEETEKCMNMIMS